MLDGKHSNFAIIRAALVAAGVMLMTPLAASESDHKFEASLNVSGTARFTGTSTATVEIAGAVLTGHDSSDALDLVVGSPGRLRLINLPYVATHARDVPAIGGYHGGTNLPEEVLVDEQFEGALTLVHAGPHDSHRLLPREEPETIAVDLGREVSWTLTPPHDLQRLADPDSLSFFARESGRPLRVVGTGGALSLNDPRDLEIGGELLCVLYGGEFLVRAGDGQERSIATGETLNESRSVTDPDGRSGAWHYDRRVLLLEGADIVASVDANDAKRLVLAAVSIYGDLSGDLSWSGVDADGEVDGEELPSNEGLLQAIGQFNVEATYLSADAARWELE